MSVILIFVDNLAVGKLDVDKGTQYPVFYTHTTLKNYIRTISFYRPFGIEAKTRKLQLTQTGSIFDAAVS
jgi:hypothetical protein